MSDGQDMATVTWAALPDFTAMGFSVAISPDLKPGDLFGLAWNVDPSMRLVGPAGWDVWEEEPGSGSWTVSKVLQSTDVGGVVMFTVEYRETREDRVAWMASWAARRNMKLELSGEVGLGRECVGVTYNGKYPDYMWFDKEWRRADENGEVWTPAGAYHKHPCVAVLGRGEEAEKALFDWLRWFDANGFMLEVGEQEVDSSFGVLEVLLGRHEYARMVRSPGLMNPRSPDETVPIGNGTTLAVESSPPGEERRKGPPRVADWRAGVSDLEARSAIARADLERDVAAVRMGNAEARARELEALLGECLVQLEPMPEMMEGDGETEAAGKFRDLLQRVRSAIRKA